MEGKKYRLIVFFISLNLLAVSQINYRNAVYNAFISGEMEKWKTAIDKMEKQKTAEPDYLLDLINYQYGYIGWCLGKDKKKEARHYLKLMEENLGELKQQAGETANYHAYFAAVYGFKIGLKTWRAPFLGPKSMKHAEQAIEKDHQNFQANVEMGNIWNHMPKLFGGSYEKARRYYLNAIEIMENSEHYSSENNWMYLNLLAITGQVESKQGNREKAMHLYKKALKIESKFIWVKKELLPSLN
jgi:tetratricopeptide (TPR) repeat protein